MLYRYLSLMIRLFEQGLTARWTWMRASISVILASSIALPVCAVDWNVYGAATLDTEYSDNKRLTIEDPDEGFQTTADIDLNAARVGRKDEVLLHADFQAIRYNGIEFLNDENNVAIRASGSHKPNRTVVLGWYGEFARDTTSNRQPRVGAQIDENSEFDVDTGLTREQFRTKDYAFGPNVRWQVSKNLNIVASYNFREVDFPQRATDEFSFFDFRQHSGSIRADYNLDERQSLSLTGSVGNFESTQRFLDDGLNLVEGDVDTDSLGASLGYRLDLSKTVYFGLNAGFENIETSTDFPALNTDETEFVYRIFAVSRGETNRLLVSYGRSVAPSGVGRLLQSDLARAVYSYRIDPRQSFRLRASYLSNKPIGVVATRLDREFWAIEPSYSYALNRRVRLGIAYEFRSRELRVEGSEADNHSISANIRYQFGRE